MKGWLTTRPYGPLVAGFGLGMLVGVGMLIGALTATSVQPFGPSPTEAIPGHSGALSSEQIPGPLANPFSELALHASATDSGDTFGMATGMVAEGVEGVFFMDYLTGDLTCWVMNRRTGTAGGIFKYNVINDLGVDPARKKPRYLMVTGLAQLQRSGAAIRFGDSIVYVADGNTGAFAVYAVPWNRNAYATNNAQAAPLILLGKSAIRGNLDRRP